MREVGLRRERSGEEEVEVGGEKKKRELCRCAENFCCCSRIGWPLGPQQHESVDRCVAVEDVDVFPMQRGENS